MNSAHSLSWLPVNMPKNVKIILSTLTGYFGIVETLQNMIEIPENFAQVSPFILVKLIYKNRFPIA